MSTRSNAPPIALGVWLLVCAIVVYVMIVVGGITRLTQSGLSMVEWAPIMGVIPPITQEEWFAVFAKYQTSPEYQLVNKGMSLSEFKQIFWWEYGHRVLGRFIGLIYLLPLLFFWFAGMVPKQWKVKLSVLFVLGGLQGLMGWYMVKSGLVDVPHVSQYRLTAHLGLALIILAVMWWFALDIFRGNNKRNSASKIYRLTTLGLVVVVFLMMLSGGFVAGIKAGFIMNTFPMMGGQWLPDGLLAMQPWWKNFFENAVSVQFMHRVMAVVVVVSVLLVFFQSLKLDFKTGGYYLLFFMLLQVSLGIIALLLVVPVFWGAAHQAGAVALFATSLWVAHRARYQKNTLD